MAKTPKENKAVESATPAEEAKIETTGQNEFFGLTEEQLIKNGWQKTNMAASGEFIYTKHLPEGFRYAELANGKVVDVRNNLR